MFLPGLAMCDPCCVHLPGPAMCAPSPNAEDLRPCCNTTSGIRVVDDKLLRRGQEGRGRHTHHTTTSRIRVVDDKLLSRGQEGKGKTHTPETSHTTVHEVHAASIQRTSRHATKKIAVHVNPPTAVMAGNRARASKSADPNSSWSEYDTSALTQISHHSRAQAAQ